MIDNQPIGAALNRNLGSSTAPGEAVERELDAMILRRSRLKDPEEESELWQESSARFNARRREENRQAWEAFHAGQAERLRRTLEELLSHHEAQAEKYADQPEGAT